MTLLVVDNLSPFTPDIANAFTKLGVDFVIQKYFEINRSSLSIWGGFVLSGRRAGNRETNVVNAKIIAHCRQECRGLLGICYGAEILSLALGGSIRPLPSRIQGVKRVTIIKENDLTMYLGRTLHAYESHGLAISRLPIGFLSVASSSGCPHEIICNVEGNLWGTQFHPEKSGTAGSEILSNFAKIVERLEPD